MESFQVVELDEGIKPAVLQGLAQWKALQADCAAERPALLAISPKAAQRGVGRAMACRTVLLPGQLRSMPERLQAASVVSYGVSSRDSLTLSSCRGHKLCVALQRELVTVEGQVVERQEFPVSRIRGMGAMPNLAAVGTLLLLGVPPEELMDGGTVRLGQ